MLKLGENLKKHRTNRELTQEWHGEISKEEYDQWRYRYPRSEAEELAEKRKQINE